MASKVNTKFVLVLVLAIAAGAMIIGGLYFLKARGNATRNAKLGDEAMQAGDYRKARDLYGRAVYREPGNMQYVAKLEDATLHIIPKTADESNELFNFWLSTLQHGARHDATNHDRHLRLLRELVQTARRVTHDWRRVATAGNDMWERVPASDPERVLGKVYKDLATFRMSTTSTLEEVVAARDDMKEIVAGRPDDDFAWSVLVTGEFAVLDKMREQGRRGSGLDEQYAAISDVLQRGLEKYPNSAEMARMKLADSVYRKVSATGSVSQETVDQDANRLANLLTPDSDPGLIAESIELLASVSKEGMAQAQDLLSRFIEKNPDAADIRLAYATLCFTDGKMEQAEQAAKALIDAPPMPVGLMAQIQLETRKRAAGLIVDIEADRWRTATAEQRPERMEAILKARNVLDQFVVNKEGDPQLLKADARIAFTKGDYVLAAKLYDRLVRDKAFAKDVETIFLAAQSLERVNQIGTAYERILQALELRPNSLQLILAKAQLEYNMGRRGDAANTVQAISASDAQSPEVRDLVARISNASTIEDLEAEKDPVVAASANANTAILRGQFDNARNIYNEALKKNPNNLTLLYGLMSLEWRIGQLDAARAALDRMLTIDPNNQTYSQIKVLLEYEDPVKALVEFNKKFVPNEKDRVMSLLSSLRQTVAQQQVLADQWTEAKDEARAAKAREYIAHGKAEIATALAEARRLAPDDPRLLEIEFSQALEERNWTAAGDVVNRAKATNADQAGGFYFAGRLPLAQAVSAMSAAKVSVAADADTRAKLVEATRNLESATAKLGFSNQVWKALGYAYRGLGNFGQAEHAFEQAYSCNPNDLETVRAYVELLMRRGEQTRSLRILRAAHQFAPGDLQNRHLWLQVEADAGDRVLAIRARRLIYHESPDDALNAAELARLLGGTVPTRELITDASGKEMYTEQRWSRMSTDERERAITQAKADWSKESDAILDGLAKKLGNDMNIAVLRADLQRQRGDISGGEKTLQDFIAQQGDRATIAAYIELAKYQNRVNHVKDAVETLQKCMKLQDPVNHEADRELAQIYMLRNQYEKALEHFDKALAAASDRTIRTQAIECLIRLNRLDDAESRLKELTKEGEDSVCTMLSATIASKRGDMLLAKGDQAGAEREFAKQRDELMHAQAQDPQNPVPRLVLAQSFVNEYNRSKRASLLDDALRQLEEADRVRAGLPEVGMLRVQIFKERGDRNAAIGELKRMLSLHPDLIEARRELIQQYLAGRQGDEALVMVEDAIKANPTLAVWYEVKGDLYKQLKSDANTALEAYTKAYDLTPTVGGLLRYVDAAFAVKTPDCNAILQRINDRSSDLETSPLLREFYARALNCMQRRQEALDHLRQAYLLRKKLIQEKKINPAEITIWFRTAVGLFYGPEAPPGSDVSAAEQYILSVNPGPMDVYELRAMAKMWIFAQDPKLTRTIAYMQQAIDRCTDAEMDLRIDLMAEQASYLYSARSLDEAAALYESVLKLKPDNIEALNNLSYLLADEMHQPAKALPYAEQAAKIAAKLSEETGRQDPSVLDTVGWVYFLSGDTAKAENYIRDSIRIQRTAPVLQHLAAILAKKGDVSGAKQTAEEAMRLNPDPATKEKLERLLAEITKK